jgi:pimeloyl-ACP methyl ester carboxylesterase
VLAVLGILLFVMPALGTGLMASAIAKAPNRDKPAPGPSPPPAELAEFRAYELRTAVHAPDATLSSWVLEPPSGGEPRGTIVVLHGVRLDKRSMLPLGSALARAGYRAVLVDLRGHGRSTGDFLTYGVVESHDVSEVLDALSLREKLGPVGVHGFSYGAATAIELAADDPRVSAVVSVAAFASLRHVVRDYVRWQVPSLSPVVSEAWLDFGIDLGARVAAFDPDRAAPARAVAHTHAALLLMHGTGDTQVPASNARAICEASLGRAELRLLEGRTHASILADADGSVQRASISWFDRHLKSAGHTLPGSTEDSK